MNFDDMYAGEAEFIGWDFANRLETSETIQSATFAVTDPGGADVAPANILKGAAIIEGSTVRCRVGDLVSGARYAIVVTATTAGGRVLKEVGVLRIRVAA